MMDRRDQARPSLVDGEVRASWDERRRQTKTRPRRRQHLPAGDTRPLRRCMATCSRNDSPSHNSWSALGGRWIASDHLGLTSPHVLSGSGFCCISAAPGATPPRPTLPALRPPPSAPRCGSSLQTVRPGLRSRSRDKIRTFPRWLPAAADLVPGIRYSMSRGHQLTEPDARHAPPGCHSHPCKPWDGRPSNLHDEQDS